MCTATKSTTTSTASTATSNWCGRMGPAIGHTLVQQPTTQFAFFLRRIIRWTHTHSVPEFAPGEPPLRYGAHFRYLRANGCRLVLRISGGCFFSVPYQGCEIFSIGPPWGGFIFSLGSLLGAYFRTALCGWTYGTWMVNFSPNPGTS